MNGIKRVMGRACAAALALTMLGAPGAQALTLTGLETETVDRPWERSAFFSRMESLTGIAVQAHGVTEKAEYAQLLADMQAGQVNTEVLFKASLTREQERALLDAGALVDLAPLIDTAMPNLSALLAENPQWRQTMALEDGRIASLPLLNTSERQVCVWINAAWLDKLGVPMPQTLDELTDALRAMRDGDPNGNGKQDEVPADLLGVYEMRWLLPYFGIVADDYHLARNAQGEIVFAPELPAYRDFIEQLRDWTAEGLLGQDALTGTHSERVLSAADEDDQTVTSGLLVSMTPYTAVSAEAVTDYQALLLTDPSGIVRWRDLLGSVWTGCFAVTSACADPGEALAWADALYAEEGALLGYVGVQGEDYTVDAAGSWAFLTTNRRTVSDIRAQVLMYTGEAMPGLYPSDFIHRVDSAVDQHVFAQSERVHAVSEQVTSPYVLDAEAQARADELAIVLGKLVDSGIARFATGEIELTDEHYAAWLDALREAGSGELTALFAGK